MSLDPNLVLDRNIVVGPFQCNCRVLVCKETGLAAIVDPGDEAESILAGIAELESELGKDVRVTHLLHTHAHLDHIGATKAVKEKLGAQAEIFLHEGDQELYRNLKEQGKLFGLEFDDPTEVDQKLEDNQTFQVGKMKFEVVHTPGHSPGSVCFQMNESSLFSGDTLFQGSIGRTDLWGGDMDMLLKSIRERIFSLDRETTVLPGHGPATRVEVEKKENPFFQ